MKYFCNVCKERILKSKKEVNVCSKCGEFICGRHCYSYVDGCNIAITKNAPNYCADCVKIFNIIL